MPDFSGSVGGFWQFCALRQEAYWQHAGSAPKSAFRDPIIAGGHFCNVLRELDAGTAYFQAKVAEDIDSPGSSDLAAVLWHSLIYRPINRRRTFEDHGWPTPASAREFAKRLKILASYGYSIFTDRHLTCGMAVYQELIDCLTERGIGWAADKVSSAKSLTGAYRAILENLPGMGPFFAWQVTCDLLESGVLPYPEDDWVKLGPGALRGLQLVHGRTIRGHEHVKLTRELSAAQGPCLLGTGFRFPPQVPRFTLKNIEHGLCEYARYVAKDWAG